MSMIPSLKRLIDAGDDAERAKALLAAPWAQLLKYSDAFSRVCHSKGFEAGAAYVGTLVEYMCEARSDEGRSIGKGAAAFNTSEHLRALAKTPSADPDPHGFEP